MALSLLGSKGRVVTKIARGRPGEVMLDVRGGQEAYIAYAVDGKSIDEGTQVYVVDESPGRVVYVTAE